MNRFAKIVSLSSSIGLAIVIAVGTPALAAEPAPADPGPLPVAPVPTATETGVPAMPDLPLTVSGGSKAAFSPAGCAGKTDNAHWSNREASVHGRTTCSRGIVSALGVTTSLQKQGWLYWETMNTDSSSRANSNNSQDAHPHWSCGGWGSQNYRGISTHYSREASGTYNAETSGSENRFSC
ncbi:hypothetical protein IT072_20870 (plasmid) [Leifsonia sp. ZF2019]|uniref:hypothetical protein n=1 Tax=Leifsonia sp. ZF2019 TaxID=2781978 RepID=UPI001CBFBD32|nr:hypothetical protein [Leifsonia sp. ZF2019]UAJ81714.1 hypothetical protein IT072_20870 [Leifsonia sp. ZF2019]